MRILLTGGSGFIGKYVVEALLPDNEILIIGRNSLERNILLKNNLFAHYKQTDYSLENLLNIFSDFTPEAIIHLASPRLIEKVPIDVYLEYLSTTYNLFDICLKKGVNNLVMASSQSVYSHLNPLPWSESIFPDTTNNYGLSKLWVEETARFFCSRGLRIKTLRLAQVIGLGERQGYVLQTFLANSIIGNPLNVYGKNIGKRQYIYVKDVAESIKLSLNKPDIFGIFNIGMSSNYSFLEIAKTINSVFGNKGGIIQLENEAADENEYLMDISKVKEVLRWFPKYDIEDAYKDVKNDLKRAEHEAY